MHRRRTSLKVTWSAVAVLGAAAPGAVVHAQTVTTIEIRARAEDLSGMAQAASEGVVSAERLAMVPLLRPGEVLEMVPGLLVTQHAGDGKANQYFLRGFNLDHGTDFATFVDACRSICAPTRTDKATPT